MNDIEVGEYVRTVAGYIGKIIEYDDGMYTVKMEKLTLDTYKDDINKHSKNIIDVLEVGDIVNGYKILDIDDSIYENSKRILIYRNKEESYERWICIQECDGKIHMQNDIESVLTHEQYEANCYRLEE